MTEAIKSKISCPIFLAKEDLVMNDLVRRVNQSVCAEEKKVACEEFVSEINEYLECSNYDPNREECQICQAINKLRQENIYEPR